MKRAVRGPPQFYLPLKAALYIFAISNFLSAAYAPIQDCDEIFNYWEPTHYVDHGYGLQTWEYSPEYSIRSWLFITLHAAVGKTSAIWTPRKVMHFYAIRGTLAFICAACETRLYSAICRRLNAAIGLLFAMIVAFSPGFFHASTSLLPSSFAMYTSMLGLAAFLNRGKNKIAEGIMWFGVGAIAGWPFSGALLLPLVGSELLAAISTGDVQNTVWGVINGGLRCFAILVWSVPTPLRNLTNMSRDLKLVSIPFSSRNLQSYHGISSRTMCLVARAEAPTSLAPSLGHSTFETCS